MRLDRTVCRSCRDLADPGQFRPVIDLGNRGEATPVPSDGAFDGTAEVVGSDRSALPGLLPVGFPGPPAEPGVPITERRVLHEIMPPVSVRAAPPARVRESPCLGSGIGWTETAGRSNNSTPSKARRYAPSNQLHEPHRWPSSPDVERNPQYSAITPSAMGQPDCVSADLKLDQSRSVCQSQSSTGTGRTGTQICCPRNRTVRRFLQSRSMRI